MDRYFEKLPEHIKPHVREITKSSGLPMCEASLEKIAQAWLEKKRLFEEQIHSLYMVEIETIDIEDPRGALMLTYSGSLISLGTLSENRRWAEYASIGLRQDVPDIAKKETTEVIGNIRLKQPVEFKEGPIRKSSPLLKIAVCGEEVATAEQEKRIREATTYLTNGFVEINKTIIIPPESLLRDFTMKSMISYVAQKNGIPNRSAKTIIEDFLDLVELGVLLGKRVPIGKLGKLFLKVRLPRKARIGRNPRTGEQITITAKPETLVPKISFGKGLKEKVKTLPLP